MNLNTFFLFQINIATFDPQIVNEQVMYIESANSSNVLTLNRRNIIAEVAPKLNTIKVSLLATLNRCLCIDPLGFSPNMAKFECAALKNFILCTFFLFLSCAKYKIEDR